MKLKKTIIITGHYGSGKTNFCANLALHLVKETAVSIIDLDIVNPYFRTTELRELFAENNISLITSKYASSGVDVPALGFDISGALKSDGYVIIDVGGDDEGAKALGRYREVLQSCDYDMLYVVNKYRYLTQEADEALELLRSVEAVSGLKCTGIINNSNLGAETTQELIAASLPYAAKIAEEAGLPLVFTAGIDFDVEVLVKPVWQG